MAQSYHPGPGPGPGPGPPNLYLMIRLVFAVVNPNGVGMRCGESRVTLLYRGTPLGNASVSGFWQRPHSVKEVVATVGVDDVNLSNSNADAADFTRDAFLNDRVELLLSAHLATRIRLLNLPSPPLQVILFSFSCFFNFYLIICLSKKNYLSHGLNFIK
uniref:Late embryogenesis abundant protein LEA-2 subgroup domain-containing protein n=1 Tax=Cajanus cajan TaxID=3821 RepID=A0A151RZB9_CAJCA|nr:hypothetical protein KK1_030402 [Cajanus cajan]